MQLAKAANSRFWHLLPWLAAAIFFFVAGGYRSLGTQVLIMVLFAMSLDLALGYAGIVTLGQAAFFGVGAYGAALFAAHVSAEPFAGLVAATVAAAVVGLASGMLILRTTGATLLMLSLAVVAILGEAANQMRWLTGGDDGLGVTIAPLLNLWPFDLWGHVAYLYALAVLFLWFVLAWRVVHSPFGRSLDGIRQNPARMRAIGTPVFGRLVAAYTLSAAMAGSAGALSAQTTGFVGLSAFGVFLSGTVTVMLILGGIRRLYGAFLGATLYVAAQDFAAEINPLYWMFFIGSLLIVVVLFLDEGLIGLSDRIGSALTRRSGQRGAP
jgi:branched-chain amino acid transport system permease protein